MGYPNYYPGYQPNYGYMPPMPDQLAQLRQGQYQQQMTAPAVQQLGQISNPVSNQQNSIMWVGSKMEADNYLVAPNSAVALWDMNNPVVYLRQADSTGKPATKVYDLVERETSPALPCTPQVQYVTLDRFQELEDRLTILENNPHECADKTDKKAKAKEDAE